MATRTIATSVAATHPAGRRGTVGRAEVAAGGEEATPQAAAPQTMGLRAEILTGRGAVEGGAATPRAAALQEVIPQEVVPQAAAPQEAIPQAAVPRVEFLAGKVEGVGGEADEPWVPPSVAGGLLAGLKMIACSRPFDAMGGEGLVRAEAAHSAEFPGSQVGSCRCAEIPANGVYRSVIRLSAGPRGARLPRCGRSRAATAHRRCRY
jgi:hypothetical protein